MLFRPLAALAAAQLALAAPPAFAAETMAQMVARCAPTVAPETMLAVVSVESAGSPWVLNVNTQRKGGPKPLRVGSQTFGSYEEAVRAGEAAVRRGENVDFGLGQVNSANLARLNVSVAEALQPCRNIGLAGYLLTQKFLEATRTNPGKSKDLVLRHALSRYNTGNDLRGFRNGYVAKVERAAGARSIKVATKPSPTAADAAGPAPGAPLVGASATNAVAPRTLVVGGQPWYQQGGLHRQSSLLASSGRVLIPQGLTGGPRAD